MSNHTPYQPCCFVAQRRPNRTDSVSIPRGIVLGTNNQTAAFLRTPIDRLDDIDQLLLVLQHPVQLVVVAGTKIAHHVFIAEEEHDGHRVVQLVPVRCQSVMLGYGVGWRTFA